MRKILLTIFSFIKVFEEYAISLKTPISVIDKMTASTGTQTQYHQFNTQNRLSVKGYIQVPFDYYISASTEAQGLKYQWTVTPTPPSSVRLPACV